MHRFVLIILLLAPANSAIAEEICSYQSYSWSTIEKKSVNHESIKKSYSELSDKEFDAFTGCSVCEQDQRTIVVPPLKPFKVCHILAPRLKGVVENLIRQGEPLYSITGYRVGKTRGDIDSNGNRTGFSNHSFGIAIDVNPEQNGLYDKCLTFNQSCRLIRGGHWNPENEGSLNGDGVIVEAMRGLRLKWGGQILGRQKDFMHFSPTGY